MRGSLKHKVNEIYVSNKEGINTKIQNNNGKKNTGVIYNESYENYMKSSPTTIYAHTFLKTKYAVIGLDNSLSIELAFVLPNVIRNRFVVIQNVGDNIEIFSSTNTDTKKTPNKMFYVVSQDILFSTWGDSSHKLNLLANFTGEETKGLQTDGDIKSATDK